MTSTAKQASDSRKTQRSSVSKAFHMPTGKIFKDASIVANSSAKMDSSGVKGAGQSADFVFREGSAQTYKSPSKPSSPKFKGITFEANKIPVILSQPQSPPVGGLKLSSTPYSGAPSAPSQPSASMSTSGVKQVPTEMANEPPLGPLQVSMRLGVKFELCFGLAALSTFLGLWIFLMTSVCYNLPDMLFWVKTFALLGIITGTFVSIYSCFERSLAPRMGLTGCLFFTTLVIVGCLNLIGAYLSMDCICKCYKNPIREGGEDLVIFVLEICGAGFLFAVLLVASMSQ